MTAIMPAHDVFLSYSSRDQAAAAAVLGALEAGGLRCWMAPRNIRPGMGYGESIIAGLEGARVLVLLLSASSQTSPQVAREVERAVSKGLAILTFRIEDCALSKEMEYFLSARHWLDAFAPPREQHLPALAASVAALLSGEAAGGSPVRGPLAPGLELKHYVYISDAKVDRILGQVARATRARLALELGAEPAELEAGLPGAERSEEGRILRVRAAAFIVRGTGKVGTPDAPSDYVEGTMTMRWGPYGLGSSFNPPIAYFCGSTEATVIGLGGSAKHLVGWNDPFGGVDFGSAQPDLLFHLAAETEEVRGEMPDGRAAGPKEWMELVLITPRCMSGPEQKLEFLAKKLLRGTPEDPEWNPEGRKVLLGSPLYVALAE